LLDRASLIKIIQTTN